MRSRATDTMSRLSMYSRAYALPLILALVAGCASDGVATSTSALATTGATSGTGSGSTTATSSASGSTAATAEEPIRIGASAPLTGAFSQFGAANQNGYQLCVDLINERGGVLGRPLELIVEDNRSDTETAVNQVQRFIDLDEVDLLFAPFSSLLYFPTSTVAEQAGMVFPAAAGGALSIWERGYEYIFYFQQTSAEFVGQAPINALNHYRDAGVIPEGEFPATVALIHADDFFVNSLVQGLLGGPIELENGETLDLGPGILAEAGMEVVYDETYPLGFADWLVLAENIRASNADLVLGGLASTDEGVSLVQALDTVGYKPKAMWLSEAAQPEFAEAVGASADGIMAHTTWHPNASHEGLLAGAAFSNQDFIEAFNAAYGHDPAEDEAQAFAVCQGMTQGVEGAGTVDNAELRDWLAGRTADDPVRTIMGNYHWDERGLPLDRNPLVGQWSEGEFNFIFPPEEFTDSSDLVYPIP
jgi:branched-chain amino acid transport system substrate-binding protein